MSAAIISAILAVALRLAAAGRPVFPACWPTDEGRCGCGQGHQVRDVGKSPIGRLVAHGHKDATTNTAIIRGW